MMFMSMKSMGVETALNLPHPDGMTNSVTVDLKKLAEKARGDIAVANPITFLIRLMGGEDVDGERLDIRGRMDVAKFLAGRWLPQLQAMELSDPNGNSLLPPPLTIMLSVSQNDLKSVTEAEHLKVVSQDTAIEEAVEPLLSC